MGPEPFCGIGANTIRGVLRDSERECWARHWAEQPDMRQAKTIIGELDLKRYKDTRKLKRNDLRMVTGCSTKGRNVSTYIALPIEN